MNNKKGISAIVATVLIILITVAAVTILWAALIPMIKDKLDSGTVCLDAVSQLQLLDEGYTCLKDDGNISVQVGRLSKPFDLADIQILVSSSGDTTTFSVMEELPTANLPEPNEEKVYVIDVSSVVETIDSVKIAPVVGVGNIENVCDASLSKAVSAC